MGARGRRKKGREIVLLPPRMVLEPEPEEPKPIPQVPAENPRAGQRG